MVGYIYLITDTTNGMKYTGKHHYHIEGQLDPNYHGSGVIIKNIYKKRPETLKEEYIKTCYSEEEMCSDEQYYIKFFKTLWPNGYNLTEGGDGGEIPCEEIRKKISVKLKGKSAYNKGIPMSEETRKKIGEANKGKTMSEEARKKISESMSGEKHPMFGKHHSKESKKKISDALKGKPAPNKGKPMSEESKKKLSDSLKGKPAYNKGIPMSEEQKKKLKNGKLSKIVLQFTLDGVFIREWPSSAECGRNGFNKSSIVGCCNGKRKSAYGYIWRYKEDYS